MGRWWLPRRALAGSYNDIWKQTRWPKLPKDFDFGYWNAAPEDQQFDYPQGGEKIMLANLVNPETTTDNSGSLWFKLPKQDLKLLVRLEIGALLFAPMNIDTLVVDLEAMQLVVVRRALVGAKLDATKLELGTWSQNTPYDQQKLPVEVAALANAGKSGGPHG